MNACCGNEMLVESPIFNDIEFKLEEGSLIFDNEEGVFKYEDTKQKNAKKEEIENLGKKIKEIEKEKEEYQIKIKELDMKINNMKKLLSLDMRENEYIKVIGKKTQENNLDDN